MMVAGLGDQAGAGLGARDRSGPGGRNGTRLALGGTGSGTARRHRPETAQDALGGAR